MQVAIYARVSTPNQQQEGTIASQVQLLKQYAQQQNWDLLPEHEFLDEGVSGARLDRPALDRLRNGARRGEFDAVVVLSPDRLARNYAHQWLLVEEFTKLNTRLIFLQNPFGDTPQGRSQKECGAEKWKKRNAAITFHGPIVVTAIATCRNATAPFRKS
jgi:site-specific DNA recombinase